MPDTQAIHLSRKRMPQSGSESVMLSWHDTYKIDPGQTRRYLGRMSRLGQIPGDAIPLNRGLITNQQTVAPAGMPLWSDLPTGLDLQATELLAGENISDRSPKPKLFTDGGEVTNYPADAWTERAIIAPELRSIARDPFSAAEAQKAIAKLASKRAYVYLVSLPTHQTEPKPAAETSNLADNWKSFLDAWARAKSVTDEATRSPEPSEFTGRLHVIDPAVGQRRALFNDLCRSFETEPFESGIGHPSESIIEHTLDDERSLHWLAQFCTDESDPAIAAGVLRCLGRFPDAGNRSWRDALIRAALESSDFEIRDAAVQTAESWGGEGIIEILESHQEPETWIREYIEDVIDDLRA